ncbi:MAG: ABC transporter permease [Actinomycetota bacterium]
MRFRDQVGAAMRQLGRQKLRSTLTIMAVVIGATSVTITLALVMSAKSFVYNHFQSTGELEQVIVTREPDLSYQEARYAGGGSDEVGVPLSDEIASQIGDLPHVAGVAATAQPYVFDHVELGGERFAIEATQAEDTNGVIVHTMAAGRDFTSADTSGVVLVSKSYANKLGYEGRYDELVSQALTLVTHPHYSGDGAPLRQPGQPTSQEPTHLSATVAGVVANEGETIYFTLAWARSLLTSQRYEMTPGSDQSTMVLQNELEQRGYSTLVVKADSEDHVEEVATTIRTLGFGAATGRSFVEMQMNGFDALGFILGGIGGIALVVAVLGVVNTMVMAILERTREIGIMRACGATRVAIKRLFKLEAAFLGFWGGVFGVAAGFGLTRLANILVNKQLIAGGMAARDIVGLPVRLAFFVIAGTSVLGLLAGWYPARRAARLDPVTALHHE